MHHASGLCFYLLFLRLSDISSFLAVSFEHLRAADRLARTVVEIYLLIALAGTPADGKLHRLAFGIRHGIVQIERYEGIAPVVLRVAISIVTQLYLVRILWIRNEVDVMHLLTAPESTETEGEIAIFCHCYPVAHDVDHVVAILLAVLGIRTERWNWLLGQDAVYPVDVNHLVILLALLRGLRVVDQGANLLTVKDGRFQVLGEQRGVVVELQIAGIATLLHGYQCVRENAVPVGIVIVIARLECEGRQEHHRCQPDLLEINFSHI